MAATAEVIQHFKDQFPGDFKDARFRDIYDGFDLNAFRISDLLIMPASLNNVQLGNPAKQNNRDGSLNISKNYIAIFTFNRPIDKDKTLSALLNQLRWVKNMHINIDKIELNPQVILKRIFKNTSSDNTVTIFGIWFTINEFSLFTKENCGICWTDCEPAPPSDMC